VSSIAAVLRPDGASVARTLIDELTGASAIGGDDEHSAWCDGQAALGRGRQRTGPPVDTQPFTLDGSTWIVADARIDDRASLAAALGTPSITNASDAELILRAFTKWQERCVDYLLGDFAFAIWRPSDRRLFCARDHLGVRPLHYFISEEWLLVSSSVHALRRHPDVSDTLETAAVADFLLFGHKTDPRSTTFRDIRRLPPAHTLTWTPGQGCRTQRYWTLPIDQPLYRKDREHAEQLRELLDRAVADRLRGRRAGIFFSGGLDSATVALAARSRATDAGSDSVRAFSFVFDSLVADNERAYARAAAEHLGISCRFYDGTAERCQYDDDAPFTPEPLVQSIPAVVYRRCLSDMVAHGPIAFSGEGPDNALSYEWVPYLRQLWRGARFGRIACDGIKYLRHERRLPGWGALTRKRRPSNGAGTHPSIPRWLSPDLVRVLQLEDRWRFVMRPAISNHSFRPAAYFSFSLPLWQTLFDECDPGYTHVPIEVSHPYMDLRILRFLLALPVIPWCRQKYILRFAFRNELPTSVLDRPKAPLTAELELARIRRDGIPPMVRSSHLDAYVAAGALESLAVDDPAHAEGIVRLAAFSDWLARLETNRVAKVSA
jgi:asparagine synthase (glutamine-hydrolysing)